MLFDGLTFGSRQLKKLIDDLFLREDECVNQLLQRQTVFHNWINLLKFCEIHTKSDQIFHLFSSGDPWFLNGYLIAWLT